MIALKIASILFAIFAVIGTVVSRIYKKKLPVMIYGGEDERKITLSHEKKIEEIDKNNAPVDSKEEAIKELNRKPGID